MNPKHIVESDHRITRPDFPDYRELLREADIKNMVTILVFIFTFQYLVIFSMFTYFDFFEVIGEVFGVFPDAHRAVNYPFSHRKKNNIHSLSGVRNGVMLIDNLLSGFAFEFSTEVSSFHWLRCCSVRTISPVFR